MSWVEEAVYLVKLFASLGGRPAPGSPLADRPGAAPLEDQRGSSLGGDAAALGGCTAGQLLRGAARLCETENWQDAFTAPQFSVGAVLFAFISGCLFWPCVDVLGLIRQLWVKLVAVAQDSLKGGVWGRPLAGHPRLT